VSRKRFNDNGYDRHKIFLYKEDFNKFIKALNEAVDHVKTHLLLPLQLLRKWINGNTVLKIIKKPSNLEGFFME
jgi:predicted ATPase